MMIKRTLEHKIKEALKRFPVVLITGPRQSGKTTLVESIFPHKPYYSFENHDSREIANADPRGLLEKLPDGAVFDEIQHCPKLLSYIQGVVDKKKQNGMFILTGSQNILLLKEVKQSLAGRVSILELLPFSFKEIGNKLGNDVDEIMWKGFFPRVWDQKIDPPEAMRNYVKTYIERDVREVIDVRNISTFHKFLRLCAGRVGEVLNLTSISNDLGVSSTTVREWLSVLEVSYVVYLLPAYYENINKKMIKSPKLYFIDTGLAAYLLGIENSSQLSRDPARGSLFENLIVIELLKHFYSQGKDAPLHFFRDKTGHEVDVVVEQARKLVGIEIKAGSTFNMEWLKGLKYFKKIKQNSIIGSHVVYGGKENNRIEDFRIWPYNDLNKLEL